MSRDFINGFASDLKDMIRLKVSLGYAESTYLERAAGFDRYCYEKYPGKGDLTQAVVMDWLRSEQDASGHGPKFRYPDTEIPPLCPHGRYPV